MYQRDYIMKMIEAFARMIAAIVGLREKGELDKARALVEEAYQTVLKVNSGDIKEFDDEQWKHFCSQRSPEELEMLADLLTVDGEILIDSGQTEGLSVLLSKALELLRLVEAQSGTFSLMRFDKITKLEQKLSASEY